MPFLPHQAAESSIRRARRFLILADAQLPVTKVKNDLRRMAVVQAVAAIDSYMHALVLNRLSEIRQSSDLPKVLAQLDIPFGDLVDLADGWLDHQREQTELIKKKKPLTQKRPWVRIKKNLQKRILKETFQSYEQIGTALAMSGVKNGWTKISKELGQTPKQIQTRLNVLVRRRNQIVHEGDIQRQSRPQKLRFNDVNHREIERQVDQVEALINAIEKVLN